MNSQIRRETAIILQFPPPAQRARAGRTAQANLKQTGYVLDAAICVSGGAWYHEAAIVDADRPRKS
jgi:Protein of unknown function (DUF2735)